MQNTLLDGRYLLLSPIGVGGEARVWRAQDTVTNQEVAARLALKPVTYRAPDMFPVTHPGWVNFFQWGVDRQLGSYQIFELLEGPTLRQKIQPGPLAPKEWRNFVDQSLDAVQALHSIGWSHGDLNADNFIEIGGSQWKLLELPHLRFDPPLDRSNLFGNIHTIAPEQFSGALADVRSDLYSLGCLYYYAACGEFPHSGATNQEIAISCLRFVPTPLAEKAPGLPAAWSAWVMTLLKLEPQKRFQSGYEARQMLTVA